MKKPTTVAKAGPGVTSFADDADYIAPPSIEVRAQAKAEGAALGFSSDKPAAEKARMGRPPVSQGKAENFTLRITQADRERFADYVWRNRTTNGDAFKRLLDLMESVEGQGQ